jgi:hypothetical protein
MPIKWDWSEAELAHMRHIMGDPNWEPRRYTPEERAAFEERERRYREATTRGDIGHDGYICDDELGVYFYDAASGREYSLREYPDLLGQLVAICADYFAAHPGDPPP